MSKHNALYKPYVGRIFTCKNHRGITYSQALRRHVDGKELGVVLVLDEGKRRYAKSYSVKVFSTALNTEVEFPRFYLGKEIVDESDLDKDTCFERIAVCLSEINNITNEVVIDKEKVKNLVKDSLKYLRMLQKNS